MTKKILIDYIAKNESDTIEFAQQSLKHFNTGDTILLYGNLGSGKTFLTKIFSRLLGIDFEVTSPSFSIINQYQGDFLINHIDFYRVESSNELLNLGLDDILNMDSINFIEWPQIIENKITWPHYRIYIEFNQNNPNGRFFTLISASIK